jgi:hypothetical protein
MFFLAQGQFLKLKTLFGFSANNSLNEFSKLNTHSLHFISISHGQADKELFPVIALLFIIEVGFL